jgi:putative ABC transport system substrate-binding protein
MATHIGRRKFLATTGGAAAAWALAARAQQAGKVARLGWLRLGSAADFAGRVEALRTGLRELGYVEGKDIVIEFRWPETVDQLSKFAAELVRMNVDIIFASSSIEVGAVRQVTQTIPIVFATHADPVGIGHVASLAHPGGNITGLSMLLTDLVPKELEIFKEAVPQAMRIGVLWNPTTPSHRPAMQAVEAAGEKLGVQLLMMPARTVEDFDGAFATMTREDPATGRQLLALAVRIGKARSVADDARRREVGPCHSSCEAGEQSEGSLPRKLLRGRTQRSWWSEGRGPRGIRTSKARVETGDIIKGYEAGKGEYIELDPEELEAVAIESKRTIDIDEFVPKDEIDELYLNNPYYIVPDGEVGQQAFAVIRDAIRKEGMVAIAKVVFTSREHSLHSKRAARAFWGLRCATRMRCETRRTTSTIFPRRKYPRICSS